MAHKIVRDKEDRPIAVVVPIQDYKQQFGETAIEELEDQEDIAAFDAAILEDDGTRIPFDVVKRLADGQNPWKVFREWRGYTQNALAEALGISSGYVSQIERGTREPGRRVEARAATVLEIDQDLLRQD